MAEKTTLARCAEFFEKHGMPEGLSGGPGGWIIDGTRDTWVWVTDALGTALIEKHLWEIIRKRSYDANRRSRTISDGTSMVFLDITWDDPNIRTKNHKDRFIKHNIDELALLLQAAEEVNNGQT